VKQDLQECKDQLVYLAKRRTQEQPEQSAKLDSRDNKDQQVCKVTKARKDYKGNKDRLGCAVLRVFKEFAETLALKESKEPRVLKEYRVTKEQLVCKALKVFRDRRDCKV
jgi:hypothetical protein